MTREYTLKEPSKPEVEINPAMEVYTGPRPPVDGRTIGIDCHPDIFSVAAFRGTTPHDAVKESTRENLSMEKLLDWAKKECTPKDLLLMEAGGNSFEIHSRLLALGLRAEVLESAFVGKHAKVYADNDRMAAARIALVYMGNITPCVWVPDPVTRGRRELLHLYQRAVANHTAALNTVKSYLNQNGIRPGKRRIHETKTQDWIREQCEWTSVQLDILEFYFSDLTHNESAAKALARIMAKEICAEPLMLRTMKLLGIGVINAFALLAVIGEVKRFSRAEKLVAYLGLNPGQRESGNDKRIKLGVGRRGRGDMRHLLVQGAHAILRKGNNTPLGQWGWRIFARKGNRNIAVAAIARKLAVQIWHLLSGNPPKQLETDKSLTTKLKKLLVLLGKTARAEIGLTGPVVTCVEILRNRISEPAAPPL